MSKPRITVTLERAERSALMQLANTKRRTDRDMAGYIIRRWLELAGYIKPATPPTPTPQPTSTNGQDKAIALAISGLLTDTEWWHKQWYLEEILIALGKDLTKLREELNVEGYDWDKGIAP
jgi:hypothetical protein